MPKQQEPAPPGRVEVLAYAPGFEKARTDDDMAQVGGCRVLHLCGIGFSMITPERFEPFTTSPQLLEM